MGSNPAGAIYFFLTDGSKWYRVTVAFYKSAIVALAIGGFSIANALAGSAAPAPATTDTPAPSATMGPDWVRATPQQGAAVRFERTTSSGPESLSGQRQVCDCTAAQSAATVASIFKQVPSVKVTIGDATMCGQPATNVVVTGYAHPGGTGNNLDMYYFRLGDSLYTLTYAFRSDQPAPDAVATLPFLCPHSPR